MSTDLTIIGGGPGGYVAAIRAAQLGLNVIIVEKEEFGGTCLNHGCIPTKALFKDAQVLKYIKNSDKYGIKVDGYSIDLDKVQDNKNKIINTLTSGVEFLLKSNKVKIEKGIGKIINKNTVEVVDKKGNKKNIITKNILISTGSKPSKPPIKGIDLEGVIDSTEALKLNELPKEVVIVGGGVIGIEFAGILSSFGSKVTVVEFLDNIIPNVDYEISDRLKKLLTKNMGVKILVGTKVNEITKNNNKLQVKVGKGSDISTIDCDKVLISTGRDINIEGLNLDNIGVKYDKSGIKVDKNYQTSIPGIYAIGDVIGNVMLAHVASEEGKVCVERMCKEEVDVDYNLIPNSIFTFPEVSTVGLSEQELKSKGIDYVVSKFDFSGNGKALTMHESDGMVKVLASTDKTTIYGVHIIGPNASDLIHEAVIAMKAMLTVDEVANTMHGHPTLPEALAEAMMGVLDKAIHMPPKKTKK